MRRPMTAKERKAASARMVQAWKTRRARAARAAGAIMAGEDETLVAHVAIQPTSNGNGHPSVEHRLVLRVQGTELTLDLGEARQLREALTEALPTP